LDKDDVVTALLSRFAANAAVHATHIANAVASGSCIVV
jgi:hypothetical protein